MSDLAKIACAIVWCGGGEQGSKHTGNDSSGGVCSHTHTTTGHKYQGTDASKMTQTSYDEVYK